jgi:hypothetical protein
MRAMAKDSTRSLRLRGVGRALQGDAIGRERARLMQAAGPGGTWQSYPAKVGRWTQVCTDSYTGFGKTVIVFAWFFSLLGAMLNLSSDSRVENPGYSNGKPKHWRLKKKVWQVDPRFVQILDPNTGAPLGEHELYIPYTAVPGPDGVNTDPARGVVSLQYLGDPRRTGLLLPYGMTPEQSIPAVAIVPGKGGGLNTLAVGPWYLDSPRQPA